jgi:diguanylate cyclase (GGDEF)-like protein
MTDGAEGFKRDEGRADNERTMETGASTKKRPATNENIIALAESNVLFFSLHETIKRALHAFESVEMLQTVCDFVEGHLPVQRTMFTFTGPETQLLQRAAAKIGRHSDRDPALASLRGGGTWRHIGERSYFEICGRSRPLGYVSVVDATTDEDLQRHARLMLEFIATQLGMLCENAVLVEKMHELSRRDPLTGLMNRRALEESVRAIILQQAPATLYMIDIDHFKAMNDSFGHAAGDEVLRAVALSLSTGVRACDIAARYGGEELVVVLRDVDLGEARAAGESVRKRIEHLDWQELGLDRPITVSVGASPRLTGDAEVGDWVRRADEALSLAKEAGRNRVVVWTPTATGVAHTEWVLRDRLERSAERTGAESD